MNTIEERVYTLADSADSLAAELYNTLETIRYDPVGAMPDDLEYMKEINSLLRQALKRVNKVKANVGRS